MNKTYYELELIALDENQVPTTRAIEKYLDPDVALEQYSNYGIPNCKAKLFLVEEENNNKKRYIIKCKMNPTRKTVPVKKIIEIDNMELNVEQQKAYDLMIASINYYADAKYANLLIERLDDLVDKMQNGNKTMDYELLICNAISHFADEGRTVNLPTDWYSSGFSGRNGNGVCLYNHKLNKHYYIYLTLKYDDFYKRYYCEIRTEGREFYNNFIFALFKNNTQKKLIEFIYNEIECIIYDLKKEKKVKYEQLSLF